MAKTPTPRVSTGNITHFGVAGVFTEGLCDNQNAPLPNRARDIASSHLLTLDQIKTKSARIISQNIRALSKALKQLPACIQTEINSALAIDSDLEDPAHLVHEFCAARQYFVQEAYPGSSVRTALVHGMLLDRKLKIHGQKELQPFIDIAVANSKDESVSDKPLAKKK